MKRLYRSRSNRVIAGVCGGIGEYLNVDPVAVRLAYVVLMFITAIVPMLVVYLLAIFIIPEEPHTTVSYTEQKAE